MHSIQVHWSNLVCFKTSHKSTIYLREAVKKMKPGVSENGRCSGINASIDPIGFYLDWLARINGLT